MDKETLTQRPLRLLYTLYTQSKPATIYTVQIRQSELAKRLGISRQTLSAYLRKLRSRGYVRTGRGFIDITEDGLRMLGISANPSFVFIRISPLKRKEAHQKLAGLPVQRVFRVSGDMDAVLIVEREKLDEALRKLTSVEGVRFTRSYVTTKTIK